MLWYWISFFSFQQNFLQVLEQGIRQRFQNNSIITIISNIYSYTIVKRHSDWLHIWSIKMVADMNFVHFLYICKLLITFLQFISHQESNISWWRVNDNSVICLWKKIMGGFFTNIIYVIYVWDLLWSVRCECPRIYFYKHEFYDLQQLSRRVNVGIGLRNEYE